VNEPPSSTIPHANPSLLRRRLGYAVTTGVLTLLMGAAAVDAIEGVAILGVDSDTVREHGGGIDLAVTYGVVSRPALATPFDIEVHHDRGFDGPITIAVDQEYLRMWDENGLAPAPAAETTMGPWVVWEFDPPSGDTLLVTFDGRIEPAAQEGRAGAVAVLDDDDDPVVDVSFTTRVLP
jgi:hypothetical protein